LDDGACPYLPGRRIKQQLDKSSGRRRLPGTDVQPTQSKIGHIRDVSHAGVLPGQNRPFGSGKTGIPTQIVRGRHENTLTSPFNCAGLEFYAHRKAISRLWQTINHSSDSRHFLRQGGNYRLFTRPPGPLADDTRTVVTNIFRTRSLACSGFFYACEVDGNRSRKALLMPTSEKSLVGSSAVARTAHHTSPVR